MLYEVITRWDTPKSGEDVLQILVAEKQWVSAGEKHFPNFRMVLDIGNSGIDGCVGYLHFCRPYFSLAGTETAIHGALVANQKQNPVRIFMDEVGDGGEVFFAERIWHTDVILEFHDIGHRLFPYRIAWKFD